MDRGRARLEAPDLSEKGGLKDGQPQRTDERLFMQFMAFGASRGAATIGAHLQDARIDGAVYEDLNDPTGVGILTLYPAWVLQDVSIRLFETLRLHPQTQQTVEILRHTTGLTGRIASGIATILIAPIGEEILFRGILYPWAKRRFSQQLALWGTAILFGAIHANLASFVPLTMLAVLLVWLYEYTGNLLAPIAVHCVFNAANFVALYYQRN